mmetsp:Transcript_13772/g.38986  ORF Transcript_13772/g.38986 Transcript_13772/m.38986 type:complete len:324 (+) Transcript_13772:346-1317(+)
MAPLLSFVPEAVAFRGYSGESRAKRTLLVRNSSTGVMDVLVTKPLSGLFKLIFPQEVQPYAGEEPEFFHTVTVPAQATLKFAVEFCPDKDALQHYESFQDIIIFHSAAQEETFQVPIKACKDQVPMTSLRRAAPGQKGEQGFWPPSEELASWADSLVEELKSISLGAAPPASTAGHRTGQAAAPGVDTAVMAQPTATTGGVENTDTSGLSDKRSGTLDQLGSTNQDLMPPQGLSLRRPMPQPAEEESNTAAPGVVTLEPPVVLMGRTAFSTTKQSKILSLPATSKQSEASSPGSTSSSAQRPETLYIIAGGSVLALSIGRAGP